MVLEARCIKVLLTMLIIPLVSSFYTQALGVDARTLSVDTQTLSVDIQTLSVDI